MNIEKILMKIGLKKTPAPSNFVLEFSIDSEVTNAADAEKTHDLIMEILDRMYGSGYVVGTFRKEVFDG